MRTASKVRIGVAGAGIMGERHARILAGLHCAELTGVYDLDPSRTAMVAERHDARVFTSLDELCSAVDAVVIASPTTAHAAAALLCLQRDRHVLIEKPLAATPREALAIVERAAGKPGLVAMAGHIERFNPAVVELKRLLKGRRVVSATFRRLSQPANRCLDTDVVHDLMIHDIDLALDLFGDNVTDVDAAGEFGPNRVLDDAVASIALESGAQVTLLASRVADRRLRTIEVRTQDAWIEADLIERSIAVTCLEEDRSMPVDAAKPGDSDRNRYRYTTPAADQLSLELQHFAECVANGTRPLVDVVAGFRALIYASTFTEIVQRTVEPRRREPALVLAK
jgi:predicted dehydrogenase